MTDLEKLVEWARRVDPEGKEANIAVLDELLEQERMSCASAKRWKQLLNPDEAA